jgi:Uma2 family endonuclease
LFAPVDVVLSMTDVVQPDLVFVRRERLNIIIKKNIVAAPGLIVEILSTRTEAIDRSKKKELYEQHSVKEYWLVEPEKRQIECFSLEEQTLVRKIIAQRNDTLTSFLLAGFSFEAGEIFP